MVDGCAVGLCGGGWIRVGVYDFVAALLAFANDLGDAAKDALAFGVLARFIVAVEDLGVVGELGSLFF